MLSAADPASRPGGGPRAPADRDTQEAGPRQQDLLSWPRRTVEQHHGEGVGVLDFLGVHQSILIIVGLHHADVMLAAPA